MRWDSPFVLAAAGTLAIHVILLVVADAVVVYNPYIAPPPTPRIEMVEIEVPPVVTEPPPPVAPPPPEPEPEKPVDPPPQPKVAARTEVKAARAEPPPVQDQVPVVTDPSATAGGDQVVTLDSAQTGGIGVPVAVGKRTSERVGRGGQGGGTGAGSGSGSAVAAVPVSVATIKKRALPKGEHGYFDAGRDYPPEARQLGIEGAIKVRLVVDATGKVTSKVLLNKLGHGLDELALKRAGAIEFEPALDTDNQPVSSVVIWTFNMTLPK